MQINKYILALIIIIGIVIIIFATLYLSGYYNKPEISTVYIRNRDSLNIANAEILRLTNIIDSNINNTNEGRVIIKAVYLERASVIDTQSFSQDYIDVKQRYQLQSLKSNISNYCFNGFEVKGINLDLNKMDYYKSDNDSLISLNSLKDKKISLLDFQIDNRNKALFNCETENERLMNIPIPQKSNIEFSLMPFISYFNDISTFQFADWNKGKLKAGIETALRIYKVRTILSIDSKLIEFKAGYIIF